VVEKDLLRLEAEQRTQEALAAKAEVEAKLEDTYAKLIALAKVSVCFSADCVSAHGIDLIRRPSACGCCASPMIRMTAYHPPQAYRNKEEAGKRAEVRLQQLDSQVRFHPCACMSEFKHHATPTRAQGLHSLDGRLALP
jgi:hypothetical protein